ncbi:MAG: ParB N-terminal domain-containing protein [Tenuifilaceae bacterium]|jgi:ParB family chromosome partitioning protein|nr:ParB N-terminal domain-containing protein [Tenuifilaceae bacterium]
MNRILDIKIANIKGASYNPRAISEERIAALQNSLKTLGVIKPIIIRGEDGTILAGHQRTKSASLLGHETIKGFVLSNVNTTDEVRFNQLHNLSECEVSDRAPRLRVKTKTPVGEFSIVKNKDITIISPGEKNQAVNQISKLILRYGQFANAVINERGEVIISAVYAKAVKLMGLDLWVYTIPRDKEKEAIHFFAQEYGKFSYEHIEKKTFIQSLAQKHRLRGENRSHSTLYEKVVIPSLTKECFVLDFGAGQRDYAKMLTRKGYNVHTLEFFLRKPGQDVIWMEEIERDFARVEKHLATVGQYDVVVCDSVLNSVDSLEAQDAVLATLSALCRSGGKVFWSGIPLKFKRQHIDRKNTFDAKEASAFLDDNGFTGNYRYGEWYFQKYHTRAQVEELNRKYISSSFVLFDRGIVSKGGELYGSSYQVASTNSKQLTEEQYENALRFEFSLPLPAGARHAYADRVIGAYRKSKNF